MERKVYEFISRQTNDQIVEWKKCKRCSEDFAITQKDVEMLDKISPVLAGEKKLIPPPTLCPDCRMMRKLCFRDERKLYRRKCDATGKLMISMFPPESDFVLYDPKYWNQDGWTGEDYAQTPDFSRSFFDQFLDMSKRVPKRIIANAVTMENCDYSNYGVSAKDCYLSSSLAFSERCHYSYSPLKCLEDIDGYTNIGCQYTYGCVQCSMSYKLYYSNFSMSCRNSAFLYDCVNCEYCFGCVNLVGQKYYFMNEKLSEEEYNNKVNSIMGSHQNIEKFKIEFKEFTRQFPKAAARNIQSENCFGNHIINAKNCNNCFSVFNNIEDSKNCFACGEKAGNLYDCYQVGAGSERLYEATGCTHGYKSAFIFGSDPVESYYTERTIDQGGSSKLFLCSGLKHKHYSILNKSYTPEEWEDTVLKIINKMESDGERGEYFHPKHSPFSLNDTPAMDHFPIYKIIYPDGKEEIFNEKGKGIVTILQPEKFISKAMLDLGGEQKIEVTWRTKDIDIAAPQGIELIQAKDLPDNIKDVDDSILNKAIICEVSGKPYKLIKQELDFYREHNIPIPRKHYENRFVARLASLPPMNLFLRTCDKCGIETVSVYDKNYSGQVYCESCYRKEIYG